MTKKLIEIWGTSKRERICVIQLCSLEVLYYDFLGRKLLPNTKNLFRVMCLMSVMVREGKILKAISIYRFMNEFLNPLNFRSLMERMLV